MILSIESSCDDSSIALTSIENAKLLYHFKHSQDREHSIYGGVVPELASRLHADELPKILQKLSEFLQNDLSGIKAIAITTRPGLSVSLIDGLMMAKALSLSLNLPLICVNHLVGHIYSLFINRIDIREFLPLGILLISGGHTQILRFNADFSIKLISSTLDDSFGESFDKVAKNLNLGYPGGPLVEKEAKGLHNSTKYAFSIPLQGKKSLDFSFSGLKNAARLAIQKARECGILEQEKGEICAAFEKTACLHLLQKCELFLQKSNDISYFGIVGGASANVFLRENLKNLVAKFDKKLLCAPLEFCSDNAAMIGRSAINDFHNKKFSDLFSANVAPKSLPQDFI